MSQERYTISHHNREDIFRRLKAIQQTAEYGDTITGHKYIVEQVSAIKLILSGNADELYKVKRPEPDPLPQKPALAYECPRCGDEHAWYDSAISNKRECLACGLKYKI